MGENLDDLFRTFLAIKKAEGKSANTISEYKINYNYFVHYLDRRGIDRNFQELNKTLFREYITFMRDEAIKFEGHAHKADYQRTRGLSPGTINSRLKTLRTIFRCLEDEEITPYNPTAGVKNIPNPLDDIKVLTVEELKRLFKAPDRKTFAGFRDYTIMNVLLDGMMRIGETVTLKETDFDFKDNSVTIRAVNAKSRKSRTLPLKPMTIRLIKRLIELNEEFNTDYIFLLNYGEPISSDHFRKRLGEHAEMAKISKHVHPHLIRHTAATLFLEDGGNIRHLQLMLGHADLRMVLRYTHLTDKSLIEPHTRHSPINRVADKLSRPRKTKL